jgi:hypothetical protein
MFVMNTVWLKIAAVIVLIVVAVVFIHRIAIYKPKPTVPDKTLGDTFREDEKRLRAEPNVVESNVPVQPAAGQQAPVAQVPKFRELTEEENAGASELFELAITQRKMGRLPGMHYGAMVQYCRQIIEKYPGSEYAYKAKRILADIPASDRERYHITDDEINPNK